MWNIQYCLVTEMNNLDFFKGCNIYIEASLKSSLFSTQELGATGIMHIKEERPLIISFE